MNHRRMNQLYRYIGGPLDGRYRRTRARLVDMNGGTIVTLKNRKSYYKLSIENEYIWIETV